uniref:Palmitoyltransferase n=1 Tax=Neogobius melanostomus TaxID=47308 RepID=A0A8C6U253_9GOBI
MGRGSEEIVRSVFRSGLWVRAAHTVLTWSITLVLFLHDTDLRRCEQRGELLLPVLFFLLVVLSVLLYFAVSLMDPGFVLKDALRYSHGSLVSLERHMIPDSSMPRLRRCGYCLLLQPMRARHCASCGHCVNCVGERNHRVFVLYLSVQLFTLLWATHIALSGFSTAASWEHWFRLHVFLLGALSVVGVFSLVVLILLGCHLYLASVNSTTWEFMSRHRVSYLKNMSDEENPFDRGVLCNLWTFFCLCRAEIWERVYYKNSNNNSA